MLTPLFQRLTTLLLKKFFLTSHLNLPWQNLRPFTPMPEPQIFPSPPTASRVMFTSRNISSKRGSTSAAAPLQPEQHQPRQEPRAGDHQSLVLHPRLQRLKQFWLSQLQQNQARNSMKKHNSEQGVSRAWQRGGCTVTALPEMQLSVWAGQAGG